mmetsp:Transcript_11212/g.33153  ORF Transcript_11212/g.33153 Transcript_11212/m.33153 type:complete len:282 (-) Transcript_11212:812-1657(-)
MTFVEKLTWPWMAVRCRRSSMRVKPAKEGRTNIFAAATPVSEPGPLSGTIHWYSRASHLLQTQQHEGVKLFSSVSRCGFFAACFFLSTGSRSGGTGDITRHSFSPSTCRARQITISSQMPLCSRLAFESASASLSCSVGCVRFSMQYSFSPTASSFICLLLTGAPSTCTATRDSDHRRAKSSSSMSSRGWMFSAMSRCARRGCFPTAVSSAAQPGSFLSWLLRSRSSRRLLFSAMPRETAAISSSSMSHWLRIRTSIGAVFRHCPRPSAAESWMTVLERSR